MTFIKCIECGQEVSDKVSVCPNCRCPLTENIPLQDTDNEGPKGKRRAILGYMIVLLVCMLVAKDNYAYTVISQKKKPQIGVTSLVADDKDSVVVLSSAFAKAIEKYDQFSVFSEGRAAVCYGNKWGYINTKGEEVIPATIDAYCVGRFSEGLAFVAYGNNDADFSFIDRTGKTVFKGSGFYYDTEFPHCEDMPYFHNGQIFIPMTTTELFNIYDKEGNLIDTADFEEKDSYYRKKVVGNYTVFDELGEGGQGQRKCGIKDSGGNVVVPAKYNSVSSICKNDGTQVAYVSNGVALVTLIELDDDYFTNSFKFSRSEYHDGYVDLKGNDTFSMALKERTKNAEIKAYSELAKQKAEEEHNKRANMVKNYNVIEETDCDEYPVYLGVMLNGKRVKTGIGSYQLMIIDEHDYDGNGINDCLLQYDELGGAHTPSYFCVVYYDEGSRKFKMTDPIDLGDDEGWWYLGKDDVKVEYKNDKWLFTFKYGIERKTYCFDGSKVVKHDSNRKKIASAKKTFTHMSVFNEESSEQDATRQIYFDINGDGEDELLVFTSNSSHAGGWGRYVFIEKIYWSDGRVTDHNIGGGYEITFLTSKTNGVYDILIDDIYLVKWNGNDYKPAR